MSIRPTVATGLAATAGLGLIAAAVSILAGHLQADPGLSPTAATISDYAATDRGGAVESGMFLCGLASLLLLAALTVVRAPLSWPIRLGAAAWSAGLIVAAYVPTDQFGLPLSTSGYIHRYASLAAFVGLLIACALLVRRMLADPAWRAVARLVGWLTGAAAIGGAVMLATAEVGDRVLIGLFERVLTGAQLAALVVLAYQAWRLASRPRLALA